MDMLAHLPPEIFLEVLSYLTIQSLAQLRLVSHHWKEFLTIHESTIFHNAASLHHFSPSYQTPLSELPSVVPEMFLRGIDGWKDFCRARLQIHRSWLGKGPSCIRELKATGRKVHRIKVDEKAGIVITTHRDGGLLVTDLHQDEVLWSLSDDYVRPLAHCEYENGFLIFDRYVGSKEVWRISHDYDPQNVPTMSRPDIHQINASLQATQEHGSVNQRGHFKPWAVLEMDELTRAYRFVYPTLLVASVDRAFLWNIPSAEISQIITGMQALADDLVLGAINYVELSERYVFVCGTTQLRIFSRTTGALLQYIPDTKAISSRWEMHVDLNVPTLRPSFPDSVFVPESASFSVSNERLPIHLSHQFVGVHISSCGRHLAAVRHMRSVYLVRDFERLLRGEVALADSAMSITIGTVLYPMNYLAVMDDRVAVAMGAGIFVITLEPERHGIVNGKALTEMNDVFPHIAVARAPQFSRYEQLVELSCLQMGDCGLYFTWNNEPSDDWDDGLPASTVFCIDVHPQQVQGSDSMQNEGMEFVSTSPETQSYDSD